MAVDFQACTRIVTGLSGHYALPCTVSQGRGRRSYAYICERHITLGSSATSWTCYHEFAHLLLDQRVPGQGHLHNRAFFQALCDVLGADACALHTYPWAKEYPRLARWYRTL